MAAVQRLFTLQKRFSVTGGASIDPASCAVSSPIAVSCDCGAQ